MTGTSVLSPFRASLAARSRCGHADGGKRKGGDGERRQEKDQPYNPRSPCTINDLQPVNPSFCRQTPTSPHYFKYLQTVARPLLASRLVMPNDDNRRIRPRLRAGREANARSPSGSLLRCMQRHVMPQQPGWHKRSWRGVYVSQPGARAQRVVVKAQSVKPRMSGHTSWRQRCASTSMTCSGRAPR